MTKKKEEAVSGSKEQVRPEGQENVRQESGSGIMKAMEEEKILDAMKKMMKKLLGKVEIESCCLYDVEYGKASARSCDSRHESADASREHWSDHERRDHDATGTVGHVESEK